MNVKQLKKLLSTLPDKMEVILQKDSEGNGFSPLCGGDKDAVYIPENTWSGDVYDRGWSADDADMDEEEWDKIKAKPRVLILYPIN